MYAIGDVNGIPLKMGKPLPKAGVFAEREAKVVARNIALEITGKGESAAFDGHGECFIETGDGRAGFGRGDFYAEPTPKVDLYPVGRRWHLGKVLFESGGCTDGSETRPHEQKAPAGPLNPTAGGDTSRKL